MTRDFIRQFVRSLTQRLLAYAPQPVCNEAALIRKIRHEKPDLAPAAIATELAAAKRQFLNDLPADRRIQARARELLRLRALPYSTDELNAVIAILASLAIACHLLLRYAFRVEGTVLGLPLVDLPLAAAFD